MKQMIRSLAYQLTRKRICEDALPVREIKLRRNELSFFCLSTNPIISFTHEGQLWYFRECPRILPAEAYWNEAVDRFFDSLDRLTINKEYILLSFSLFYTRRPYLSGSRPPRCVLWFYSHFLGVTAQDRQSIASSATSFT